MVRNSKHTISNDVLDRLSEIFIHLLISRNKTDYKHILQLLFTKAERMMLLKRIGIQYMLLKQNEKVTICELLKVSSSTVAYYSIQLENQKEELVTLLKSILLSEKVVVILEDVISQILIQPNLYGSHKQIKARYDILKTNKTML